ncbi:hypothetical protein BZK31_03815 [Pseudomonas floridensis]|uniref:Uncharacterized protein n=1 Tax=Pseudomonas floridensis TaxID=1958950 RepID=A0A1X0NCS3_9PSED|nr:hypothetical protein BZK31_03815 [Pseudomonas floridensis]
MPCGRCGHESAQVGESERDSKAFSRPLISGSEAIMPRRFCLVKRFVVLFINHYIIREKRLTGH